MTLKKFNLQDFMNSTGSKRKKLACEVDGICKETGFLLFNCHGVPSQVIKRQWYTAKFFFSLNTKQKSKVSITNADYLYGWIVPRIESLTVLKGLKISPDQKECFRWISTLRSVSTKSNQKAINSLSLFNQPDWDTRITLILSYDPTYFIKPVGCLRKNFV